MERYCAQDRIDQANHKVYIANIFTKFIVFDGYFLSFDCVLILLITDETEFKRTI